MNAVVREGDIPITVVETTTAFRTCTVLEIKMTTTSPAFRVGQTVRVYVADDEWELRVVEVSERGDHYIVKAVK